MAKILGASKVKVRHQVTIPEEVRRMLKIKKGDTLVFAEEGARVFITTEVR
jgi:AbrB family looped-hinge helix DNA binding protein